MDKMDALQKSEGSDLSWQGEQIEEVMAFLELTKKWNFEISLEVAQTVMKEILDKYIGGLEEYWWGNGAARSFPPNLITLAEKLGFNVERFSKITNPKVSIGQS